MASCLKVILLLMTTLFSFCFMSLTAYEFQVGDKYGWRVPPSNDTKVYNDWASDNRFKIGDTLRFRYRKDSVMQVDESDYMKCNSTRPILFYNNGDTVYKLNKSGPFYFMSGASGHCQRGQRMIVKVLYDEDGSKSNGHKLFSSPAAVVFSCSVVVQFVMSYLF